MNEEDIGHKKAQKDTKRRQTEVFLFCAFSCFFVAIAALVRDSNPR
jgi:hypothetical protein